MIEINLLPMDLRVNPPRSSTRVMIIAASVAIALTSFSFYLYIHFSTLQKAREGYEAIKQEREKLEGTGIEKQHKEIERLVKVASEREESVAEIRYMRSDLSRKLNEFAKLCANHPVWFDGIEVRREEEKAKAKSKSKGKKKSSTKKTEEPIPVPKYVWSAPGTCEADELKIPVAFYQAMENDENFFRDIISVNVPNYSQVDFGEDFGNAKGYTFRLEMQMQIQPPEEEEEEESESSNKTSG